ncbi:Spc98 family-domain-containing protein [Xylariaceae sp. FL0016]|nr:Spc98 family-domain-containing protein [Xylariaceae sp. FL0016]
MPDDDLADVFAFPDFGQSSKRLKLSPGPDDQFFHTDIDASKAPSQRFTRVEPSEIAQNGFFKLPTSLGQTPLSELEAEVHGAPPIPEPLHEIDLPDLDIFDDFWYPKHEPHSHTAEFKTWDGFSLADIPPSAPLLITEAGPAVYDAAIASHDDPLGIDEVRQNVIRSDPGSVFFVWDDSKRCFSPDLEKMRISGYSSEVLRGIQKYCLDCGSASRFLSMHIQHTYKTHPSAVKVALAKAVDVVLFEIQRQLGEHAKSVSSVLSLQSLVKPVHNVLVHFRALVAKIARHKLDEDVLSFIFEETQVLDDSDSVLSSVMREVLARASEPWTNFVERWIGLKAEEGIIMTKEGPGRGFVKVENIANIDDFGLESEESDYVLDEERMPAFVPGEVAIVLFETGKTLRLLRSHHPDHSLCDSRLIYTSNPPPLGWRFDWTAIRSFQEQVDCYERDFSLKILEKAQGTIIWSDPDIPNTQVDGELQFLGCEAAQLEGRLLASINRLNELPAVPEQDKLSVILQRRLFAKQISSREEVSDFTPHWSLIPLHSFGPLVSAQARMINREYMRLLFSVHHLRENLRVQKEFQLLGNGIFCSRLSSALFDPELATAERQAGVAMTGGVMGLRINGRENWPPASSELRLALMGVLNESYFPFDPTQSNPMSFEEKSLPGDLSFAVRDLSPEEIDKCMDPNSLEALDFLRLSYKTPAPLSPIVSSVALVKYDKIFKFLLRVLRMLYVVEQLFRDTARGLDNDRHITNTWKRFRFEAQHFVTSVSTYFFDTGIDMPWRRFESWLMNIEAALLRNDNSRLELRVTSPDEVRQAHERMLDCVMNTLLLRKRQQPVLKLLEEIFTLVLKFSRQVQLEVAGKVDGDVSAKLIQDLYRTFRKKVGVFVTVCRGISEKESTVSRPARQEMTLDSSTRSERLEEENIINRLLMKLEMSGQPSGRNLTLTEELEKLEQSITLTLQEIDHNFSKAHRIVTSSILPIVEQYGEHSNKVWEASKFWKQFFEASANVSLSGYEELAGEEDETQTEETTLDDSEADCNNTQADTTAGEQSILADDHFQRGIEDSLLDDMTVTGSTPRAPATKPIRNRPQPQIQFAKFGDPYENLRREMKGTGAVFKDDLHTEGSQVGDEHEDDDDDADDDTMQLPAHTATMRLPDMSMTPRSSSMLEAPTAEQEQSAKKNKDLLLHRVLDKNYRLQATPHKSVARGRSPEKGGQTPGTADRTRRALWADSPMSSPEMAVPKLRSDLYMSPVRLRRKSGGGGPRTPGVSVQTPATSKKRDIFAEAKDKGKGLEERRNEYDWDSDDDDTDAFGGMSPPKTIQFAMPQSKLMQTPAREASRRIVDDIMITAGAIPEESYEYSPTMVKPNKDILDDTF